MLIATLALATEEIAHALVLANAGGCHGQLRNRLTRFDYARYLWALLVAEGMTVPEVFAVWDTFDIGSTDPDDNGIGGPSDGGEDNAGSMGTGDDPLVRWKAAMATEGFLTEHVHPRDHGLDHDPDSL